MVRTRAALLATACLLPVATGVRAQGIGPAAPGAAPPAPAARPAAPAAAARPSGVPVGETGRAPPPRRARATTAAAASGTIATIRIEGNRRIEDGTIRSYMLVQPGDPFASERLDRSLRTLYATGLFSDVNFQRQGSTLVVRVTENPLVNQIAFEGNRNVKEDVLRPVLQLRPRAVFTAQMAQADRQRLLDLYAHQGRYAATVEPQIIRLPDNRVNVVFRINEGRETLVSRITFVGNHAFSENRLGEIISTRQEAFYRFFSSTDQYDPERVNYDKELLRRFYLRNGYADVDVTGATAELSPDRRSFFLTFTIREGARYTVGKESVDSQVAHLDAGALRPLSELNPGDVYDGDAVQRGATAMQEKASSLGFVFAEVNPRIARDRDKHTVDLVYEVSNGPRVYVERIDISGNTRTEDKVIRREFQVAEGDAFNAAAVRRTRQRLQDLGYFQSANITPQPGSTADRTVLNTVVQEKATGELTLGGGYSTDAGVLGQVGLRERNLVGTGIDANISGTLAQRESQANLSVTDPYFLDRNLVAGFDLYQIRNDNLNISNYEERRTGGSLRLGYQFNDHLSQAWTYSIVDRNVYNVNSSASIYVQDEAGQSLLSQLGQTLSLDYRDSRTDPHSGFVTRLGTDFAGIGGDAHYGRFKLDGTAFIPLDRFTGDSDWGIAISAGAGYLADFGGRERIIDRFFLGGDNLRGFQDGGVGPHSVPTQTYTASDSLGGEFIYTQSTELHFPLPVSPDFGLSGRAFADVGGLQGLKTSLVEATQQPVEQNNYTPRVGVGVGVSWRSPFGLINVDLAYPVVKQHDDKQQIFRFGFGTRF